MLNRSDGSENSFEDAEPLLKSRENEFSEEVSNLSAKTSELVMKQLMLNFMRNGRNVVLKFSGARRFLDFFSLPMCLVAGRENSFICAAVKLNACYLSRCQTVYGRFFANDYFF
jgi:hypothetical protein